MSGIATRYETLAVKDLGLVTVTIIQRYLRLLVSPSPTSWFDGQCLLADPMLVFHACVAHRSQIGGAQTVHAQEQRDFAAMMQIVFQHMVDHPTG